MRARVKDDRGRFVADASLVKVNCLTCGEAMFLLPWRARRKKFCSLVCCWAHPSTQRMRVANGRKSLGRRHSDETKVKISLSTLGRKGMPGESNPAWKNGHYSKIEEWREAVFKRDGYACVSCGDTKRGRGGLTAHHIKDRKTHPKLIYDVNNGETLCGSCHMVEHERRRHKRGR